MVRPKGLASDDPAETLVTLGEFLAYPIRGSDVVRLRTVFHGEGCFGGARDDEVLLGLPGFVNELVNGYSVLLRHKDVCGSRVDNANLVLEANRLVPNAGIRHGNFPESAVVVNRIQPVDVAVVSVLVQFSKVQFTVVLAILVPSKM